MMGERGRQFDLTAAAFFLIVLLAAFVIKRKRRSADQRQLAATFAGLSAKERMELLWSEWKTTIDTQMHFNEMIIRMRTLGVTAVVTVFGAAAFAIGQYPERFYRLLGERFHVSEGVIFFGLVLLVAIFIIDFFYYYRLLLGAVKRSYDIDDTFQHLRYFGGLHPFGMSRLISRAVGSGRTKRLILVFYGAVLSTGLAYLLAVHVIVDPPPPI